MSAALICIAVVCGNLCAVLIKPANLGLFWNSVCGALGGSIVAFAPGILDLAIDFDWYQLLLLAGAAGFVTLLVAGITVAAWFRFT